MELRLGKWQDVLADVTECGAVITDPPYTQRTERGFRTCGVRVGGRSKGNANTIVGMGYDPIDQEYCKYLVSYWTEKTAGWLLFFCDHISFRWWESAIGDVGRYVFPPVIWVKKGAAPRMSCDGPASQCEYIAVGRPREKRFLSWGALPGWYIDNAVSHGREWNGISGAKPLKLMRNIINDYTRPNDLIIDLHVGGGTTLLAAAIEGRRAIGAECDPETFEKAVKRLSRGYTPSMLDMME